MGVGGIYDCLMIFENLGVKVHITQGDHVGKGVIVSWVTPDEPGSNTVLYWAESSQLKSRADGFFRTYKYFNYTSGYIHHCTIKNLEASTCPYSPYCSSFLLVHLSELMSCLLQFDTKYYYEVGIGNTTRQFWFITAPKVGPDVSYTFGLIGNSISCTSLVFFLNL